MKKKSPADLYFTPDFAFKQVYNTVAKYQIHYSFSIIAKYLYNILQGGC